MELETEKMDDGCQQPMRPFHQVKNVVSSKGFYCQICHIRCTSAKNLNMHFNGAKHKRCKIDYDNGFSLLLPVPKGEHKSMRKTVNPVKINVLTSDVRLLHGASALEQHLSDADIHDPIIGLNHVIEYQSEVSPDPMFFCQLCKCHGDFSRFISHIFGLKHRLNYIKKMHPDMLQLDGPKLKHAEWYAMVKGKAKAVEKIEGRGNVKVVQDEIPRGNTATKRASDTRGPFDANFPPRENYRSSFHGDMEKSYDARMRRQDGQLEDKFSRHENFGSHLNRGHSNSYESRGPYSQDCRSSGDVSHDSWRKDVKSEVPGMDWRSDNTRNFGDEYRRRDLKRNFQKNDSETPDVDDRWMRNEFETDRMDASSCARLNEELFKYLQDFEIFNDSDASFVLKIIHSLMDGLMEYHQKTGTGINEEKRPQLHEEIRRSTGILDRGTRRPSGIMDGGRRSPLGIMEEGMRRPYIMDGDRRSSSGIMDGERRPPSGIMDEGLRRPFGMMDERIRRPSGTMHDKITPPFNTMDGEKIRHSGIMDDGIRQPYGAIDYRPGSRRRFPRYTGNFAGYGPKYKGGVSWKKAVGLQFKANSKKKFFPPNRKYIKPTLSKSGVTKSKGDPNLLKVIHGMDIHKATKRLTKLSKLNPSLKGLKVSSLVDVLVEADGRAQTRGLSMIT